jgi:hypothetical protein
LRSDQTIRLDLIEADLIVSAHIAGLLAKTPPSTAAKDWSRRFWMRAGGKYVGAAEVARNVAQPKVEWFLDITLIQTRAARLPCFEQKRLAGRLHPIHILRGWQFDNIAGDEQLDA